ncbi:hypothetical protein I7I50_11476 [Histoplasma capsulatum G186AR]|uniref:Uncharacterized protein n=1 Tax=Ajellomyces capsulatus TaxID=5037 RepID=A0A8H7Z9Q6_AJECA|nr:hypothetical protein I7I52_02713 [Histoplasma capsulatum]QSS69990.1 hypothetical protein I7I50_11476 [Histoplasma capsulatum G186AR]
MLNPLIFSLYNSFKRVIISLQSVSFSRVILIEDPRLFDEMTAIQFATSISLQFCFITYSSAILFAVY